MVFYTGINTAVFFVGINQLMLKHQNDRFLVVFCAFGRVLPMAENDLGIRQWQAYKDTDAIRKIKKKPKENSLGEKRYWGEVWYVLSPLILLLFDLFFAWKTGSSCIVVGEERFRQIKSLIEIGPGRFGNGISIAEQNSKT